MKKLFLIKLLFFVCTSFIKGQNPSISDNTRTDTIKISNNKRIFSFQTPFESITSAITDKKDAQYAQVNYDRVGIPRREWVIAHLNSLNKDIETKIFKKMLFIKSICYEKSTLGFEDYINIQEWVFKNDKDAIFAIKKLEKSKYKPMESFIKSMNWIWVRSNNIVYYIDTTCSYESLYVSEILQAIEKKCSINSKGFFEPLSK